MFRSVTFRGKLFGLFAAVVVVMISASILLVNERFNHFTHVDLKRELVQAPARFDRFQTSKMNSLISRAANIATDPSLRGTLSTRDRITVARAADQTNTLHQTDLFWMIDLGGVVLHRVEQPQAYGDTLQNVPVVRDALNGFNSGDLWLRDGELFQVSAVPIGTGRSVLGVLLIGERFDAWILKEFATLSGLQLGFLTAGESMIASEGFGESEDLSQTLLDCARSSPWEPHELPAVPWTGTKQNIFPDAPFHEFQVGGIPHAGALFELRSAGHDHLGVGLVFRSMLSETLLLRRIREALILVGIGSILLGLLATWVLARQLTQPIKRLVSAAAKLGAGDMDSPIQPSANDEIGSLARALDDMRQSLKKTREELLRAERMSTIGQMASTITHDFRQPISAIYGYMQLMALPTTSPEDREEYSRRTLRQIDRMQGMINELLDFARDKVSLNFTRVRLFEFVQEVTQNFEQESLKRKIKLKTSMSWDGEILMDRDRLERGVENIVRNAMQAIDRDGLIELRVCKNGDYAEICIADNGPGIPEEVQARLFEAFATHGKKGGTGLGLAVASRVVREHGGEIEVQSETGAGTTFKLRLPLTQPSSGEDEQHAQGTDETGG
ncbi:HAMP domain-containing protein [bacterium]|nr:HAMP domain-containing protein [bacterium]